MAHLEDKIAEIPKADLRQTIAAEVAKLKKGTRFGLVMQETRFKGFARLVEGRANLTHVFVVTHSSETVYRLRGAWPTLCVLQLYKDSLKNFRIHLSTE